VAEDRRDCYWLYVVTDCDAQPRLHVNKDPASLSWHEVKKVDHYWLNVDAMREPMRVREEPPSEQNIR
jgi:nanoRNase/pAp phosphatase (c-di-AMP/oligoRNAs hydrolase)